MFNLENIAILLGLKKPKKFAFLRNGVQPVVPVKGKILIKSGSFAGNVELKFNAPKGKKYKIHSIHFAVATDATVANRYMTCATKDIADNYLDYYGYNATAWTASGNYTMIGSACSGVGDDIADGGGSMFFIPNGILLNESIYFYAEIASGGQAGDAVTYRAVIEEIA